MTQTQANPSLLRCDEAAVLLNCKPSTIRSWILRKKVPVVRVSARMVRIPREALLRMIAEATVPAKEVRERFPQELNNQKPGAKAPSLGRIEFVGARQSKPTRGQEHADDT